jgi:hypothetical protein
MIYCHSRGFTIPDRDGFIAEGASRQRTHDRFGPTCHFEQSEKSFPMHMVKISQSQSSFEMTKVEIILTVIKKPSADGDGHGRDGR